jgi:hypothetical protein
MYENINGSSEFETCTPSEKRNKQMNKEQADAINNEDIDQYKLELLMQSLHFFPQSKNDDSPLNHFDYLFEFQTPVILKSKISSPLKEIILPRNL